MVALLTVGFGQLQSADPSAEQHAVSCLERDLERGYYLLEHRIEHTISTMTDPNFAQYLTSKIILDLLMDKKFESVQEKLSKKREILSMCSESCKVSHYDKANDVQESEKNSELSEFICLEMINKNNESITTQKQVSNPVHITCSKVSANKQYAAAVTANNRIQIGEVANNRLLHVIPYEYRVVDALTFSQDGTYLAVIVYRKHLSEVMVIHTKTHEIKNIYPSTRSNDTYVWRNDVSCIEVKFSEDNKFLAVKFKDNATNAIALLIFDTVAWSKQLLINDYRGDFGLVFRERGSAIIGFYGTIATKFNLTMSLKDKYFKWLKTVLPQKHKECSQFFNAKLEAEAGALYVTKAVNRVVALVVCLSVLYSAYHVVNSYI